MRRSARNDKAVAAVRLSFYGCTVTSQITRRREECLWRMCVPSPRMEQVEREVARPEGCQAEAAGPLRAAQAGAWRVRGGVPGVTIQS